MIQEQANQQGLAIASLFVRRPVMAFVINAIIFIAGGAAILGSQVQELPNVSRPVVTVSTSYPGASADTVDSAVTEVIEGAVARVSGVTDLSSSSRYGSSRTTVEFSQNVDLNVAASDVRDAVSRAVRSLPDDAQTPQVVKADTNAQAIMQLSVTSTTLGIGELTDLVDDVVIDPLMAVQGVADIQEFGDAELILTVDVNPAALAARGLTLSDLSRALGTAAYDTPGGTLNATNQNIIVRATASLDSPDKLAAISLGNGVTIGDVATVYIGPNPGGTRIRADGQSGVGLGVIGQAQSNTIAISNGIREKLDEIRALLPPGVNIVVSSDDATFIRGAVEEVVRTMLISIAVVTAIIFIFLRDWRATLIPAVSMPIALSGALAGLWLAGFSVNILTLLALVLAAGLVVDDAIVVLENIVRHRGLGAGPRAAAVIGTQEVYFAVLATTVTLVAVFVPISFLPGQAGGLFREFGFTLAIAVLLSSVVALSLTPMMGARLPAASGESGHTGLLGRFGSALARFYHVTLRMALASPVAVLVAALCAGLFALAMFNGLRQELTPPEDRAQLSIMVRAPQNVSLDYTNAQMNRIADLLTPLRERGEIANIFAITGFGGSQNSGFISIGLVPRSERARSQQAIQADVNNLIAEVPGVRAFAMSANSLKIRGGGNGLQFALVGNDYDTLAKAADTTVSMLSADPRFGGIRSSYDTTQAQVQVLIDRQRADTLGVDISGVGAMLQAMLDGRSVGTVEVAGTSYELYVQSTSQPINDPTDLQNIFARTGDGRFVPLSTFVTIDEGAAAPTLTRESQQRAITITAALSDGFAIGDAYEQARAMLLPVLPKGTGIIPLAEAATVGDSSSGLAATFGFAALVILLVLAAQFESFVSAGIIMVTVPFGLACAVFALVLTGGSLNVFSQIGLVLLIGIMAKNGILVVEFANQLRDRGRSVRQAIEEASMVRLRPIMMTNLSTVLGALPLVLAGGPGSEARAALGWVIVGALGFAAITTLYLTPATYLLFAGFSKARADAGRQLADELARAHTAATPAE